MVHVLMIGTGEYTCGLVPAEDSPQSGGNRTDKKLGVVALVMFDLRRRKRIQWLGLCGTSHAKVQRAQRYLCDAVGGAYRQLDARLDAIFPPAPKNLDELNDSNAVNQQAKQSRDTKAYQHAIDSLPPGSAVTIFTPDSTHFEIAAYALEHGHHVMLAKPATLTSREHHHLAQLARQHNRVCCVEFHKRFDPIYADARDQMRMEDVFGDLGYFSAYMSQPKYQLATFRSWAGKESDISYYLNSHHIDFLLWALGDQIEPVSVVAMAARGVAVSAPYHCHEKTEDTITLTVQFRLVKSKKHTQQPGHTQQQQQPIKTAVGVFTASWTAPDLAEVHSQQRFQALGSRGEIRIDQAHRGYEMSTDARGYTSRNPLFMRYTPNDRGEFAGQQAYGYLSFQYWIDACKARNEDPKSVISSQLAAIDRTLASTAILEAGRKSLDAGGCVIQLQRSEDGSYQLITRE